MTDDQADSSCHRVYAWSITIRVWTSRRHGLLALTSEESAREDAQNWVREHIEPRIAQAVAEVDEWAKDIQCSEPCAKREERELSPTQYTFRDITDDIVECTGRADVGSTITCEAAAVAAMVAPAQTSAVPAVSSSAMPRWWVWTGVAAIVAALAAVVSVLAATHGGPFATTTASPSPASTTSTTATATSSPGPAGPTLTGTYAGTITVLSDPNGHAPFIGPMPSTLEVRVTRNTQTNVITVQITGPAPFIAVTSVGNYQTGSGSFTAMGAGTVTSRSIPVTASVAGTLVSGRLSGTLTLTGTPNGPISYGISMTRSGA